MRPRQRFDWSYLLLYPFLSVAFIPWLKYKIQFRWVLVFAVLWAVLSLMNQKRVVPKQVTTKFGIAVLCLIPILSIQSISWLFGHGDAMSYSTFVDGAITVLMLLIFAVPLHTGQHRELKNIVIFSYGCLCVSALLTISGLSELEGGARALTSIGSESASNESLYLAADAIDLGIGGYGSAYGLVLLIVPLLYCIRWLPFAGKVLFTCISGIFLVAVYKSGFSTAVFGLSTAFFLLIFVLLKVRKTLLKAVAILMVAVIVIFTAYPFLFNIISVPLNIVSSKIGRDEYVARLESVKEAVSGVENTYAIGRAELYWVSARTFWKHPLVGVGHWNIPGFDERIGGHSQIFDVLGMYGLSGMSLYVIFFIYYHRYMRALGTSLGVNIQYAQYLSFWPAMAIAFINPLLSYMIFADYFLLIPGMMFLSFDRLRRSRLERSEIYNDGLVRK